MIRRQDRWQHNARCDETLQLTGYPCEQVVYTEKQPLRQTISSSDNLKVGCSTQSSDTIRSMAGNFHGKASPHGRVTHSASATTESLASSKACSAPADTIASRHRTILPISLSNSAPTTFLMAETATDTLWGTTFFFAPVLAVVASLEAERRAS
ncbi:hypothetical protein CGGC5_v017174 [Colletotrichum fructicola Nara gc5]|uniref:Uncharacterized protein n=1 Tax=Colletotrichum fructicola (strain Nara gc5) TaxID=1213859 RepID=A0A7J6IGQ5_COLFN|nr:hypothetical protein CGGC5_v017174 [Colletotrichum fructicola Nara gc5]